jgi:hypothetical protein
VDGVVDSQQHRRPNTSNKNISRRHRNMMMSRRRYRHRKALRMVGGRRGLRD